MMTGVRYKVKEAAERHGRRIVQDTVWMGKEEIRPDLCRGYGHDGEAALAAKE